MMTLHLLEEASGWRFEKPKMMVLFPGRVGQTDKGYSPCVFLPRRDMLFLRIKQ